MFQTQETLKTKRIKLYNTMSLAAVLYGSENWTIRSRDARRITAAQVKYSRITAGYPWTEYKTNTDIAKDLSINPILDKIQEYRRNWLKYINRMPRDEY